MRNYLHRFTALALVPALVLADPAWASFASPLRLREARPLTRALNADFPAQALTLRFAGAYTGNRRAVEVRQQGGALSSEATKTRKGSVTRFRQRILAVGLAVALLF